MSRIHQKEEPEVASPDAGPTGQTRREEIVRVATDIFANDGYAGLSMRKVAAQMKMRLGNLQHYFQTKNELVQAVVSSLVSSYDARGQGIQQERGTSAPEAQFVAAVHTLVDELKNESTTGFFVELWALAERHNDANEALERMQETARRDFEKHIARINPVLPERTRYVRASLMTALMQGLIVTIGPNRRAHAEISALDAEIAQILLVIAKAPA